MKTLLLILLFCVTAAAQGMGPGPGVKGYGGAQTPTFVRGAFGSNSISPATASFSSNSAGDLLVVAAFSAGGGTFSISDGAGNTYTPIAAITDSGGQEGELFYVPNCLVSAGTNTVTFSGAGSFPRMLIAEYSGVAASTPLRTHLEATGTSLTPDTGNMTVVVGDLILGSIRDPGAGGGHNIGSGYTLREFDVGATNNNFTLFDKLAASTTEHPNGISGGGSDVWIALGAAFKPGP